MNRAIEIIRAGPSLTVQDLGRSGWQAHGLSRGGAVDRLALYEGAALLGQSPELAALEMAGYGGQFKVRGTVQIALSGALMHAAVDGVEIGWNRSHVLRDGQVLSIGASISGLYGYLSIAGGIDTLPSLGSRSAHLAAGIGARILAGAILPIGDSGEAKAPVCLQPEDRLNGGRIRAVATLHTHLFTKAVIDRFERTEFTATIRRNRQGMELGFNGAPFASKAGRSILSEPMVPGDIQMTGEGYPFVLLSECQTTGGFSRIAQVLPCDLATIAQASPNTSVTFTFISLDDADKAQAKFDQKVRRLHRRVQPVTRRIEDIGDLLSYDLISGAISGQDPED